MADDREPWFRPRRFGYGAGLPIRWQGWVVLGAYMAVLATAGWLLPHHSFAYILLVVVATAALIAIAAPRTSGGWRWRSGGGER